MALFQMIFSPDSQTRASTWAARGPYGLARGVDDTLVRSTNDLLLGHDIVYILGSFRCASIVLNYSWSVCDALSSSVMYMWLTLVLEDVTPNERKPATEARMGLMLRGPVW